MEAAQAQDGTLEAEVARMFTRGAMAVTNILPVTTIRALTEVLFIKILRDLLMI
jgi:hypothetical protein